jgi:hypothetical protein
VNAKVALGSIKEPLDELSNDQHLQGLVHGVCMCRYSAVLYLQSVGIFDVSGMLNCCVFTEMK